MKLMAYDFEIQYKPGVKNSTADALSRLPENVNLSQLSAPALIDFKDLSSHIAADSFCQTLCSHFNRILPFIHTLNLKDHTYGTKAA